MSLRGLGPVVLAAGFLLLGWQSPAAAHAGGLVATDARSRVVSVTPAVPGLRVVTIEDGAKLRLINDTAGPVTIVGLGADAAAGANPDPGAADGAGAAQTVAAGESLVWVDERSTPVGKGRTAADWALTLNAGGTPVTVRGVFDQEATPFAAGWWAAVVLVAAMLLVAARRARRGELVLAGAGLVAAAASIAHVAGSTLAVESQPLAGTFVDAAGINLLAWPLLVGGVVAVLRGRAAGVLAICAGAALTAVFVLPDVTSFHRAVLPFAGPDVVERMLVVLALGGGAGVAVAGAAVLRTLARQAAPTPSVP